LTVTPPLPAALVDSQSFAKHSPPSYIAHFIVDAGAR